MAKTVVNVKRWLFRQMFQNAMEHVLETWRRSPSWFFSDDGVCQIFCVKVIPRLMRLGNLMMS